MENNDSLRQYIDAWEAKIKDLKRVRNDVMRIKDLKRADSWLKNVRDAERNLDEFQKEYNEISNGFSPDASKSITKLSKKVTKNMKIVANLKNEGICNVMAHRNRLIQRTLLHNEQGSSGIGTCLGQLESEKLQVFSHSQLKSFTSNFSTSLGLGGYGEVFRGQFPDGVQVAVKVLKEKGKGTMKKGFTSEVGTIGRTYHKNLVRLYGFCYDTNMKALIYEYMENGSLDRKDLNIELTKLYDIVTDVARGLSYLHEDCEKKIIHYDIKPANVLLDSNLGAKIADFGLAKLCSRDLSHVPISELKGTYGFVAPEMVLRDRVSCKCDVYSFGIMVIHILGRENKGKQLPGEDKKWLPMQVWEKFERGGIEEIMVYCNIKKNDREKACKLCMVALRCIQFKAEDRPPMSIVVKMLEGDVQTTTILHNPFQYLMHLGAASTANVQGSRETTNGECTRKSTFSVLSSSKVSPASSAEWQDELQGPSQRPTLDMKNDDEENKYNKPEKNMEEVITLVLKVYMHCQACAQGIEKCLNKMTGVQSAVADLDCSLVTVKGIMNSEKLVEYVYKNTKKRATLVNIEPEKTDKEKATAETEPMKQVEKEVAAKTEIENEETKPNKNAMRDEETATAISGPKKKQDKVVATEIKLEKQMVERLNKSTMIMKTESEVTEEENEKGGTQRTRLPPMRAIEEENNIAKTERKKRQEEKGIKIKSEIKQNKGLMTAETESKKTEEAKAFSKTEQKKKRQERDVANTKSEKKEENKERVGTTKRTPRTIKEEKKEEDMDAAEIKQGDKEEEKGGAETKRRKDEERGVRETEAKKEYREKMKEVIREKSIDDKRAKRSRGEELKKGKEAEPEEEGTSGGAERNKNMFYHDPFEMFNDENPNACSIQ